MKIINTIFEHKDQLVPQCSSIFDTKTKEVVFIPLYLRGIKTTVKNVRQGLEKINEAIKQGAIINDMTSHALEFKKYGIKITTDSEIYETRQEYKGTIESLEQAKKQLLNNLILTPKSPEPWMLVKGKSAIVYAELTSRGVMWGHRLEHPAYNTNTLTGRSKTPGFNIQGTTKDDPIRHVNPNLDYFICFDWVSADIRVAGYLSGDDFINKSFIDSDPYVEIEKILNIDDVTREDCKLEVLKSIYSVNIDSPIFDLMPQLKSWILSKKQEYDNTFLTTILGMPIPKVDIKSSLSGTIQGTIAEAIQSSLVKITECLGSECILTEIHDSLVVVSSEKAVQATINKIIPIMTKPLDDVDIRFPVKISIGRKWKQWKKLKVCR